MSVAFAGRVVVVTGSGRADGLGAAILAAFAAEGARCVASDIAGDGAASVAATLGADAIAHACDVTREAECAALVAAALEAFGRLDILVNNAGVGDVMKPIDAVSEADWDRVLGVNLKGAFLMTKHAARHMVGRGGGGRIINIDSQAAKSGFPHMAAYCASKHGMVGLTRSNAIELGRFGITVNAVCPNHVTTGLGARQNAYFSALMGFADEGAYLEDMARRNPMGRPGRAADTAAACLWLASDAAAYITGEAINVSGGKEMH